MASYKLTYFNMKGRAEPIRLLFALAGVEYEDRRIEFEEWPSLKATLPTGQLPILEVDGTVLVQSMAIIRYVAREFNLAGGNNIEMCKVEGVLETIVEMQGPLRPLFMEQDKTNRAELAKKLLEDVVKPKLAIVDNMLKFNGVGDVFVGNELTVADIVFFSIVDIFHGKTTLDPLLDFPKLAALRSKVEHNPNVAAWLAKRPCTES